MLNNNQHSFEPEQYQDVFNRFAGGINAGVKYQNEYTAASNLIQNGDDVDLIPSSYHTTSFSISPSFNNATQPNPSAASYPANIYSYYYQQQQQISQVDIFFIYPK